MVSPALMVGVALAILVACVLIARRAPAQRKMIATPTPNTPTPTPLPDGTLRSELASVSALINGENIQDVQGSQFFEKVFPGASVVVVPATSSPATQAPIIVPTNAPTFVVATDTKGVVTGVDANDVPYNPI